MDDRKAESLEKEENSPVAEGRAGENVCGCHESEVLWDEEKDANCGDAIVQTDMDCCVEIHWSGWPGETVMNLSEGQGSGSQRTSTPLDNCAVNTARSLMGSEWNDPRASTMFFLNRKENQEVTLPLGNTVCFCTVCLSTPSVCSILHCCFLPIVRIGKEIAVIQYFVRHCKCFCFLH